MPPSASYTKVLERAFSLDIRGESAVVGGTSASAVVVVPGIEDGALPDDDAPVFFHGSTIKGPPSPPTLTSPASGSGSLESSERAKTTAGPGRNAARASPRTTRGRPRAVPTRGVQRWAAQAPIVVMNRLARPPGVHYQRKEKKQRGLKLNEKEKRSWYRKNASAV
jgi:hypothetical protein